MSDPYAVDAAYYDVIHPAGGDDINLWLGLANRTTDPVLEIGTGTGRVAIALAGAGHRVRAIDPSTAMLDAARAKADEGGLEIDFAPGELGAATVPGGDRYGLVLVPPDVFLQCADGETQLDALSEAASALAPDGRLAVDLPGPAGFLSGAGDGIPVLVYSAPYEDGWLDAWQVHEDNLALQTRTLSMRYERTAGDGLVYRTVSEHRLRYVYRFEMEYLLHIAGLRLLDLYGDYELGWLTSTSERMIFVAGRVQE